MVRQSTEVQRFYDRTQMSQDCWQWTGHVMNAGYGSFATSKGTTLSHRWSYEHFIDEIPPKVTVDHLCRNKLCVNPDHMELVTRTENIKRAGLTGIAKREAKKTHCPKGHSYLEHGVVYKNGYTEYGTEKFARRCTVCYPFYARFKK